MSWIISSIIEQNRTTDIQCYHTDWYISCSIIRIVSYSIIRSYSYSNCSNDKSNIDAIITSQFWFVKPKVGATSLFSSSYGKLQFDHPPGIENSTVFVKLREVAVYHPPGIETTVSEGGKYRR